MEAAASLLEVEHVKVETALATLAAQHRVVVESQGEDMAIYLTPLHMAEVNVARRLETLINAPRQIFLLTWIRLFCGYRAPPAWNWPNAAGTIKKAVTVKCW